MKKLIILLAATTLCADPLLQQATNQELLNEVGRRMGSVNPTQQATASYDCDLYGNLNITLISNGTIQTSSVDAGNSTFCQSQASELTQYRTHIRITSFVAACDLYGTLFKFSATPQGGLTKISETAAGGSTQCRKSATAINTAR